MADRLDADYMGRAIDAAEEARFVASPNPWVGAAIVSGTSVFTGATSQPGGPHAEINAIAAAVIGGTSLFGGRGTAWAAVLGALVVGAINNGLYLIGFNSDAQQIITALVLLTAVVIDALSRRGQRYVGRG